MTTSMSDIQDIFRDLGSFINQPNAVRIPLLVGCVAAAAVAANYVYDKFHRAINEYPPGPTGIECMFNSIFFE